MKIEKVNINDLISPDYNPREITTEEMEKLKTSIQEFGYVDPIIVNEVNNHIIGGNQRYEALKELDYEEVDVVYIHEEDINREKALNIALNKISGDWDDEKLEDIFNELLEEGFEIDLTGFDEIEINELLPNFDYDVELPRESHTGILDGFDETKQSVKTYYLIPNEKWVIGNHTLTIGEIPSGINCKIEIYDAEMKIIMEHFPNQNPFEDFEIDNKNNEGLKPEGLR